MAQTSDLSSNSEAPFFRYDLQTDPVEVDGKRYVDVSDPGGKSFRFYEVEYAVACGMDGVRDVKALVAWAKDELDLDTSPGEVAQVVAKLAELNYLAGQEASASVAVEEPAAASSATPEIELAAQTVTPAREVASSGVDVELGLSGKSPLAHERPSMPTEAADVELGLSGRSEVRAPASAKSSGMGADVELGLAGNEQVAEPMPGEPSTPSKTSVSTDLSQTFRIDKEDVQEAVRQSKVMSAAEVPEDLRAEMDALEANRAKEAAAEIGAVPSIADAITETVAGAADAEVSVTESSAGDAIVLPEAPERAAKKAAAESAAKAAEEKAARQKAAAKKAAPPRRSASLALWFVLLAAAAVGAGYYYMEFVREKPAPKTKPVARPRTVKKDVPAPPPTATLELLEAPSESATASAKAVVAWVAESGSEVAEGDPLVRFLGYERFERQIATHKTSLERYELRLSTAQEQGKSESAIAAAQANVDRKKADMLVAEDKLASLTVSAPMNGVVEILVEPRARVEADQELAKVTGKGSAAATFTLPKGKNVNVGDKVQVVSSEDAELSGSCDVRNVEGASVYVTCDPDQGFEADANVLLILE